MQIRRETPIETYAAEQLSRRRKKIRRRGAKISQLSPEQLHTLRIQVKKARYAAEFFSSVYGGKKLAKRRKKVVSCLRQLQNCLGGLNDIVTRKALCAQIINSSGRGLTASKAANALSLRASSWAISRREFKNFSPVLARRIHTSTAPKYSGSRSASAAQTSRDHFQRQISRR